MNLLTDCLTERELKVYRALKSGEPTPLEKIVAAIGSVQPEKVARSSAIQCIKQMAGKLALHRMRIKMVEGGRGKGRKGVYLMEKIT